MLRSICLCSFIILVLCMGCSGGSNPFSLSTEPGEELYPLISSPGVSDFNPDGSPAAGQGILGLFRIDLDTEPLKADIQPIRQSSLTDVVEVVDISNFLQVSPCIDCVDLKSVSLDSDGNPVLRIGIKHPFPAGDPSKPITGKNRGDLHVFNVEGLIVAEASSITIFPFIGQGVANFRLLNADGYSAYLNMMLQPYYFATIHPYKLHFNDYSQGNYSATNQMGFASVTNPPPTGNLVMAMGADYDYQDYVFDIQPNSAISFLYAIECTYAIASDSKNNRFFPDYRIPQHNKKAATKVDVRIIDNALEPGEQMSHARIEVDIVDMNHGVPDGLGRNYMLYPSYVAAVYLDIPDLVNQIVYVPPIFTGGTGHSDSDPLIYGVTFYNEKLAGGGKYKGLVKVLDTYPPASNPSGAPDGIHRVDTGKNPETGYFSISEFATYQVFEIEVSEDSGGDPVALLHPNPVNIFESEPVLFDATDSYDDSGIISYEFDFNWDGNFVADEINVSGIIEYNGYVSEGNYTACLRVTDDELREDYVCVPVTVSACIISCPNAPFSGTSFTTNFTYDSLLDHFDTGWDDHADQVIDVDALSNGNGVIIYSDEGYKEGELRIFLPEGGIVQNFGPDYPGKIGVSIDVDSEDYIVFVTSSLPHSTNPTGNPTNIPLQQRIAASDDYFTVFNPITSTEIAVVEVGKIIQAIEIDENDDVWIIDSDNELRMFDKSNDYSPDFCHRFDLDESTSNAFTDLVYDFVIDFHNDAFFILTNNESVNCNLWRIECDGTYDTLVNGNQNPLENVLQDDLATQNADIGIDNLNLFGNVLTGGQDSQIVVVGSRFQNPDWYGMISRVDSNLDMDTIVRVTDNASDGLINVAIDQRLNLLFGFEPDIWSDSVTETWEPPADWL